MIRKPLAKQIAFGLIVATSLALGTAGADDDGEDNDLELTVGPLVQVSGLSPLPPFSDCGNFPGDVGGVGVNFLNSEVEPWLDINPTDPDNIVAFWQQDRWSNGGSRGNVAGVSFDGGLNWRIVPVPGQTDCTGGPFERASDPWVSFAPDGTLHQMSLVFDADPPPAFPAGFGPNGMATSRSLDGGLTWSDPILIISDTDPRFLNDKNSMTADPMDSSFVYAVWDRLDLQPVPTIPFNAIFNGPAYFARTSDGGMTWEPAREIFDPGLINQVIGSQIVVLPDGTLLNFFNKIINFNPDGTVNPQPLAFRLTFLRSEDQGDTWDAATGGTEIAIILGLGVVTPDLGVGIRDGSILFDVAVDPDNGNLYAVWQDFRFTGFDQVAFSQSRDGGSTWTNPIKINATPADPARPFTQQAFLPSVAVADDEGTVVVTYYDLRNDIVGPQELADNFMIFCEKRCDNPASWGNEIRVTDDSFDYLQAPFANGLFLGDYVGLAAQDDEVVSFFQQSFTTDPASGFARKVILDDDDDRVARRDDDD